jgi:hypothetical protein
VDLDKNDASRSKTSPYDSNGFPDLLLQKLHPYDLSYAYHP